MSNKAATTSGMTIGVNNDMRKEYLRPTIEVHILSTRSLMLATSMNIGGNADLDTEVEVKANDWTDIWDNE